MRITKNALTPTSTQTEIPKERNSYKTFIYIYTACRMKNSCLEAWLPYPVTFTFTYISLYFFFCSIMLIYQSCNLTLSTFIVFFYLSPDLASCHHGSTLSLLGQSLQFCGLPEKEIEHIIRLTSLQLFGYS